uniref:Uncharacterized protein n=1 Tax=Arion vulgaris TaxID=1028688 RepID=A0A0B6YQ22_9EUPU
MSLVLEYASTSWRKCYSHVDLHQNVQKIKCIFTVFCVYEVSVDSHFVWSILLTAIMCGWSDC